MVQNAHETMPFTAIRWRPQVGSVDSSTAKPSAAIISITSDGLIQHWHVNSGKCLHTTRDPNGKDLYALDFSHDAKNFAVAGLDCHVYLYDEHTRTLVNTMRVGGKSLPGHSNRIFCVKFHP